MNAAIAAAGIILAVLAVLGLGRLRTRLERHLARDGLERAMSRAGARGDDGDGESA